MRSIACSMRVCRNLIRYLFTSSAPYFVAFSLLIFMWDRGCSIGLVARQYNLNIHAGGYFAILVNNNLTLILLSFGLLFILADAPYLHENALFEWTRTSRISWATGRIIYIALTVIIYMLFVQLLVCLLTWSINFGPKWDKVLNTIGMGRPVKGLSINISPLLVTKWNPIQAMGLTWLLLFLAWFFIGLTLFFLSSAVSRLFALSTVSILIFLDYFIETMMPYRAYFFSPLSWAKLAIIGDDTNPYLPHLDYSLRALPLLCLILIILCVWVSVRKKHLLDRLFEL